MSKIKYINGNELYDQSAHDALNSYGIDGGSGILSLKHGGTGRDLLEGGTPVTPYAVIRAASDSASLLSTPSANGALYAESDNGRIQFGTLKVAQGGTGATTAAAARTNLGVGTIGTKDSLVAADIPNLNASKITAGTLPVARGGTGGTSAIKACENINSLYLGDATTIASGTDLNTLKTPGVYKTTSGSNFTALGHAPSFTGASNSAKRLIVSYWGADTPMQTVIDAPTGRLYHRRFMDGAWGDWYAPGGITEIVAQGTTSNWDYIKLANGMFICWQSRDISSKAFPAFGNQFRTNAVTLSLPFTCKSAVVHTCGGGEVWGVATAAGNDTNTITAYYYSASNSSKAFTAYTLAMGRWK